MNLKKIFLMITVFSSMVFAGGREVGNGGNAVVCTNSKSKIVSVELLDYFEAREVRGFHIDLGNKTDSLDTKLKTAVARLRSFSPNRANRLQNEINNFFKNTRFLTNQNLTTISDSEHISLPQNCQLMQLAIQRKPIFSEDKQFYINQFLWKKLDTLNQAGLILHELLLKESLLYGNTTSESARYFNSVLSSKKMATLTFKDFLKLLNQTNFNRFDIGGYEFEFENCSRQPKLETLLESYDKIARLEACIDGSKESYYKNALSFDDSGDLKQLDIYYSSKFVSADDTLFCPGQTSKGNTLPDIIVFSTDRQIQSTTCTAIK